MKKMKCQACYSSFQGCGHHRSLRVPYILRPTIHLVCPGCLHEAVYGDDCSFDSFCDYTGDDDFSGASTSRANPSFATAFGLTVAALVGATSLIF